MDELYVVARRVLLDALEALGAHREAIVVVGAQAIYLRAGKADLAVAPYTTDGDLAWVPGLKIFGSQLRLPTWAPGVKILGSRLCPRRIPGSSSRAQKSWHLGAICRRRPGMSRPRTGGCPCSDAGESSLGERPITGALRVRGFTKQTIRAIGLPIATRVGGAQGGARVAPSIYALRPPTLRDRIPWPLAPAVDEGLCRDGSAPRLRIEGGPP